MGQRQDLPSENRFRILNPRQENVRFPNHSTYVLICGYFVESFSEARSENPGGISEIARRVKELSLSLPPWIAFLHPSLGPGVPEESLLCPGSINVVQETCRNMAKHRLGRKKRARNRCCVSRIYPISSQPSILKTSRCLESKRLSRQLARMLLLLHW